MAEVFDLRALVSADVSPFEKAMDSSANSVTSSLSLINAAANAYIGSGFIRTLIKATNTAYEFGQVMADISSISSVSTKEMANSIRGLDNVYGKLSDVANSAYEIISSGFDKSSEEVLHFQKTISTTAKTIRADIDATTNAMTTLANAYGIPLDQVQKISDMLFVTVREGKAQGNELARTLGLVTNTAAEAGVTLAEMAATISILSRTQSASQSMIGFNQMLNSLIKPTQEAQREAKKWGIEIGAAALQSKGFTAILTELHDKIGGNVEAINAILGNIRAMRAGTALTGRQFENFIQVLREAEREIGSGTSLEAFAKQTATAQQSLKNLEVQFDKTMEGIGKDFEPISKNLIELSEQFLKNFSDLSPIEKWSTYLTAILFTFRAINEVVRTTAAYMQNMSGGSVSRSSGTHALIDRTDALYKDRVAIQQAYLADATKHYDSLAKREINTIKALYKSERDKLIETQRILQQRLNDERKHALEMNEYYKDQIEAQRKHISAINKQTSELNSAYNANIARRSSMDEWQYAGSGAIISAHYRDVSNKASGSRSLYTSRIAKELSNATEQYLNMLTTADIDAVLQKKLNPTKGTIVAQAERNVEEMYHIRRDDEGNIVRTVDPRSGREVEYERVRKAEIKRLEGAYRDARQANVRMGNTQSEGFMRFKADKDSIDAEIAKQKAALEALGREQSTATADLEASVDAAKRTAKQSRTRIQAIEGERTAAKEAFDARSKSLDQARKAAEDERRANIRDVRKRAEVRIARLEAQRESLIGGYKAQRRHYMSHERRQLLASRFNRRYNTSMSADIILDDPAARNFYSDISGDSKIVRTIRRNLRGVSFGLSKVLNGLSTIPAVISAWTTGLEVGKAIAEHFKFAESKLFMFVGNLDEWVNDWLGVRPSKLRTEEEQKKVDDKLVENNRKINSTLILRLEKEGKLTSSAASLEMKQVALAKTMEELTSQYKRLIKDVKTKAPQMPTVEWLEKALANALANNRSIDLTAKQRSIMMEGVLAKTSTIDTLTKNQTTLAIGGKNKFALWHRENIANDVISLQDVLNILSSKDIEGVEAEGSKLLKRIKDIGLSKYAKEQATPMSVTARTYGRRLNDYKSALADMVSEIIGMAKDAAKLTKEQREKLKNHQAQAIQQDYMGRMLDASYSQYTSTISGISNRSNDRRKQRDLNAAMGYTGIDSTGVREAGRETAMFLYDAQVAYDEREKAYFKLKTDGEHIRENFRNRGLSEKTIASNMQKWEGNLVTAYTQLNTAKQELDKRVESMLEASVRLMQEQKDDLLAKGIAEDSIQYTRIREGQLSNEIKLLNNVLDNTINEQVKARIGKHIAELEEQRGKLYSGEASAISDMRDRRLRAGEIDEVTALAEEIELYRSQQRRIQDRVTELSQSNVYGKAGRLSNAQRDLTVISLKLAEAMRKLDDETRKVSSGIFNGVQSMLSPYSDENRGRMSNNQLFHILNMMSRITGPSLIQRGLMPVTARNNVRYKDTQARVQAEQSAYAAIDSYIMSKKYEEANIGKTVTNIYDYIRDNNKIMVSK